jgi:hypothetical protein
LIRGWIAINPRLEVSELRRRGARLGHGAELWENGFF